MCAEISKSEHDYWLVDKEDWGGRGFNEINKRDLGWENTNL